MEDFTSRKNLILTTSTKRCFQIRKPFDEEKKNYSKYLKKSFNDPNNYFTSKFEKAEIMVGKIPDNSYKISLGSEDTKKKTIKKMRSKVNFSQSSSELSRNEKKKLNQSNLETELEKGKRKITDQEIEEIFKNFQMIAFQNKCKDNNLRSATNFYSPKKLNKNNSTNDSIYSFSFPKKKSILKSHEINFKNLKNIDQENFNKTTSGLFTPQNYNKKVNISVSNKVQPKKKSSNVFNKNNKKEVEDYFQKNNVLRTSTTNKKLNKSIPRRSVIDNRKSLLISNCNENEMILRKILISKQNQFISNKNKSVKSELAKKLACQEKVLLSEEERASKVDSMYKYLSERLKRKKNKLLMKSSEDFQIEEQILSKINKLINFQYPEHLYSWEKNLRTEQKKSSDLIKSRVFLFKGKEKNGNDYSQNLLFENEKNKEKEENNGFHNNDDSISRNPECEKYYNLSKRLYNKKNQYLKEKLPKKKVNNLIKDLDKISSNFRGLSVKGKNLLKIEYNNIKYIKGRKVINRYDNLRSDEINNTLYAKDFSFNSGFSPNNTIKL